MPFTLSHIAGVFPFKKIKYFRNQFDALIVGSIMPDLIYFFPNNYGRVFSHSIKGVFLFSLPIGLLLLILFRYVLKDAFDFIRPEFIRVRISIKKIERNFVFYLFSITALGVGIASHLLWDGFTHGNSFFKFLIPSGYYFYLQFYSSAIGLLLLAIWIIIWLLKTPQKNLPRETSNIKINILQFFVFLFPFVLSLVLAVFTLDGSSRQYIVRHFSNWVLFGGGELFIIFSILYSLLFFVFFKKRLN